MSKEKSKHKDKDYYDEEFEYDAEEESDSNRSQFNTKSNQFTNEALEFEKNNNHIDDQNSW